ncbi:NAD(P)-binding protein [Leucogyrophana mollusca]|uniref:NAD(P)-binding protein n=1 Tax=Leucogyrophana mollusca TaxID=85980 RepID=A0ACB8BV23_9AGAM|nr:NAD(P)-binding protein [Leucogyrophana mollusca]
MTHANDAGIAILGAGLYAKEAHIPALANIGTIALPVKAVYSRSEKSARELADEATRVLHLTPDVYHDADSSANLDVLLSRPDIVAVNIVLPIGLQPSFILKAFASGKHVFSAKPIAPDVAESVRLISVYNADYKPKGLVWRIAENFETEPGYLLAGRLIREGKIGKVTFFNLRAVNYMDQDSKWYKTPWRTIPDYQGGFLLDGGVHSTSALRVILPSRITKLSSFASLNKKYLPPQDTINVIAKAEDGSHGIFEMTFAAPAPSLSKGNGTVITGTDGWLSIEQGKAVDTNTGKEVSVLRITVKTITKVNGKPGPEKEEIIEVPVRGVEAEWEGFFAAILRNEDDGLSSPEGALEDVAFIQAALNSEGNLIDLQKLVRDARL